MKRVLLMALTICVLLTSYTTAMGAQWVKFSESRDDNTYYYNQEDVTFGGKGIVKVWCKIVYSISGRKDNSGRIKSGYENLDNSIALMVVNCNTREYRIMSRIAYDTSGKILKNSGQTTNSPIPPDSMIEELQKVVCKKR
jgi:hypothetical protein